MAKNKTKITPWVCNSYILVYDYAENHTAGYSNNLADIPALGIAVAAFGEASIEPKLLTESPTRRGTP